MTIERALRGTAGVIILVSLLLARLHSEWWLLLTLIVGLNLLQSTFTNWCPMMTVYKWLGLKHVGEGTGGSESPPAQWS